MIPIPQKDMDMDTATKLKRISHGMINLLKVVDSAFLIWRESIKNFY